MNRYHQHVSSMCGLSDPGWSMNAIGNPIIEVGAKRIAIAISRGRFRAGKKAGSHGGPLQHEQSSTGMVRSNGRLEPPGLDEI